MAAEQDLIKRRTTTKQKLTRIVNYVTKFEENDDIQLLLVRLPKLEEEYTKYDELQTELEVINEEHGDDREQIEENYFATMALIKGHVKKREETQQITRVSNITISDTPNGNENSEERTAQNNEAQREAPTSNDIRYNTSVRLPDISLPQFNGNYQDWQSFCDMFKAIVHENNNIPDISKLYYLKGTLKGEALQIIKSITHSSEGYAIAWQLLQERYGNKQFNVNCHLKALFELPTITKESFGSLRSLITETKQHIRSLEALQLPVREWDAIIIYLLCTKLDSTTRKEWELSKQTELPTLESFYKFAEQRCMALEFMNQERNKVNTRTVHTVINAPALGATNKTCKVCNGAFHPLYNCEVFISYKLSDKLKAIKLTGSCINCLRSGHLVKNCIAKGCRRCFRRHNTMIHSDRTESTGSGQKPEAEANESSSKSATVTLCNESQTEQVLLSTASINVQDATGQWQKCRALLDSASQANFITRDTVNRLKLNTIKKGIPINGINNTCAEITEAVVLTIGSRINFFERQLELLILDKITCELPMITIETKGWKIPERIQIADPEFNIPGQIDILLGGEIFLDIMDKGQRRLGNNLPILQKTVLGWIVGGKVVDKTENDYTRRTFLTTTPNQTLDQVLTKFWDLENTIECNIGGNLSPEERRCERHFEDNVRRDETGRYIVKLPLKSNEEELGDSFQEASKRFTFLETRFRKQPQVKQSYEQFMKEYLTLGHMQRATEDSTRNRCYLPHHPVFKIANESKKIRVVFDASMKTKSGKSLNDILLTGPTVQQDLLSIILRFRIKPIVFTADIQKMYRQIQIDEDQLHLQCILWRNKESEELRTYHLKTVTYGTSAAPYLATRCLNQLAQDEKNEYPLAAERTIRDFYVDDVMSGADKITTAIELQKQLVQMLKKGGFTLHKWCSNRPELLAHLDPQDLETQLPFKIGKTEVKTLGLFWLPVEDTFKFQINIDLTRNPDTKRGLLSEIASIFDPLGILGPIISKAKIKMQELWKLKIGWDEKLPSDILSTWYEWREDVMRVKELQIQRYLMESEEITCIELHGFCDASEAAYGGVVYLVAEDQNGIRTSNLICSKSKVAPIKQVSLARLELCGALIVSKLVHKITRSLEVEISNTFLWTDSTTVLAWLRSTPTRWQTFVANRTSEIQDITENYHWNHVSSKENPADCLSKGIYMSELEQHRLWWKGPDWLTAQRSGWPIQQQLAPRGPLERRTTKMVCTAIIAWDLFTRFSTYTKLLRVTAYCLRFISNTRKRKKDRETDPLTVNELHAARILLIRKAQHEEYPDEIKTLRRDKVLKKKSPIISLTPFLDAEDLLRVGGRIENASISYDQRHPLILPKNHVLTKLICEHEHQRLLHAGIQAVLTSVRMTYWPINGRNIIRKIVHKCIKCYRLKAKPCEQIMGNLPKHRIQPARPFLNSGVDYGGPVYIKQGKRRNAPVTKAYFSLFICLCTRAIHIELVNDLSIEAFLAAFKRFISRRGKCDTIYSDNGTNFRGANNELQELLRLFETEESRTKILEATATEGVTWKFIPPRAPHFGGVWESGIKSVKYHLRRIVGTAHLTYEEMNTVLILIEAVLNSRPLMPLTDDPADFSILTPSHFLIGDVMTGVREPNILKLPENRLSKWQQIQRIQQHFWKRYSTEYLAYLQQRFKWNRQQPNQHEGAIVLLKEDNLPPLQWSLARIVKVHLGDDNRVRVVTLFLPNGKTVTRPITKICPLPTKDDNETN